MARRLAALLILLVSPFAWGQTTSAGNITITESADGDGYINISECQGATQDGLTFQWTISNFTVTGTYQLVVSDQPSCPTGSTGTTVTVSGADNITANSATGGFPAAGNTAVQTILPQVKIASCNSSSTAVYFCVNYNASGVTTGTAAATGSLKLDLLYPAKPIVTGVTSGDGALNVSWQPGNAASQGTSLIGTSTSYDIIATSTADPNEQHVSSVTSGTSGRIGGLTNGVKYNVQVQAFSPGGNPSDVSDIFPGTPQPVFDFWRLYRYDGGRELGGCSTGGTGIAALLALVPLALRRRRS